MDTPRTLLITGATSGIGLELARLYEKKGYRLLLLGKRPSRLLTDPLFNRHLYLQIDLSQAEAIFSLQEKLKQHSITSIDIVIHNAALGAYGPLASHSQEKIKNMLRVNFLAPILLTQHLSDYVTACQGKFVFVSSVISSASTPDYAVYTASKAALEGFARSLRLELAGRAEVQIVRPGATNSGMHAKMGISQEIMPTDTFPSSKHTAQLLKRAIATKKRAVTLGKINKLIWGYHRLLNLGMLGGSLIHKSYSFFPRSIREERGKICVITGAAKGIGKCLAKQYAQMEYEIIGIDCDEKSSRATQVEIEKCGGKISFLYYDLSKNIEPLCQRLSTLPHLDLFIHNAGVNWAQKFYKGTLSQFSAMYSINLQTPLLLTARLLQSSSWKEPPFWIFLSSLSHYTSYPGASVYAATKDGVASFAKSLRTSSEAQKKSLTVFPGPTETDQARANSPDNDGRKTKRMPPQKVAQQIYRAHLHKQKIGLPGISYHLMGLFGALFPKQAEKWMRRLFFEKLD